jgi:hypothetical protein
MLSGFAESLFSGIALERIAFWAEGRLSGLAIGGPNDLLGWNCLYCGGDACDPLLHIAIGEMPVVLVQEFSDNSELPMPSFSASRVRSLGLARHETASFTHLSCSDECMAEGIT